VKVPALLARFRRHGNFGLVALIGVQSNQYPRALDIARPFRQVGIPVVIGGFHVSGCLSMLDGHAVDLAACRDMGIAMFAGEAEGRFGAVLRDAAAGQLATTYDFLKDLPRIERAPVPFLPKQYVVRTIGHNSSFDAGRGCPYQCSFCTIINVQGRKSRYRSADDVECLVRINWTQGVYKFFVTDDNFARNTPTPLQKTPQISPIFKADTVRLHVSREKDGKLRLVHARRDDAKIVQLDGCGQARRGWKGGILPPARVAVDPPLQKLGPPSGPPRFSS
jgi:radical SAM superfamily enzyme YgiQ (UPF0313 family)